MPHHSVEETFRRLTIGEPVIIATVSDLAAHPDPAPCLDERTEALLRIAALVALDAPLASYQTAVDAAKRAGALLDDLLAVLLAVAGTVGSARVVSAAPRIALAAGYDVEAALEGIGPIERDRSV